MKRKNLLVTGGSGFIGINLLKILSKEKNTILIATYLNSKNFHKVKGDKNINALLEFTNQCLKIKKKLILL